VDALNDRLEDVLRGIYDRGRAPDKVPRKIKGHKPQPQPQPVAEQSNDSKRSNEAAAGATTSFEAATSTNGETTQTNRTTLKLPKQRKGKGTANNGIGPLGFSGNLQNVKVLQIINIHKADSLFRKLETSPTLARVVSDLAGWDRWGGARLAQDQVWAKPPGAPPLVFHRDSPYFMFEPSEVVTVWIALDDMEPSLGPLEYVVGSHTWGDGRVGSANQFFQSDTKALLWSAARREGMDLESLQFVSMAGTRRGGLSIHHGKIWHGSPKNSSRAKPRRGLGLHFVPACVRFTADASRSKLWRSYVGNNNSTDDLSAIELSEEDFPLSV
jgi:hypothetical protein